MRPVSDLTRSVEPFRVISDYVPAGDQPAAIAELVKRLQKGEQDVVLLGATGTGKSATTAWLIEQVQRPTLVMAPNKTLAAQLANEFKELLPNNAVEYFVSYYDYYQPEAYIASTNTYIEKDLMINQEIDKLRLSTVSSLMSGRRDVVVIASVSCIYGAGNPTEMKRSIIQIGVGLIISRNQFLFRLVEILYSRTEGEFMRGNFRVKGDTVDINLAYADYSLRVNFWDDEIEEIETFETTTGKKMESFDSVTIYPANIFQSLCKTRGSTCIYLR